jgi:hypothetical protein
VLFVEGKKDYQGKASDPARDEDFRKFLEKNFVYVKVSKDTEFTPAMATDVDVIIVDGDIRELVPADFHRPMVLLGADWGPIGIPESHGYKLQNTCRFLTEKLHSLSLNHLIFQGPLPVTPTLTDEIDPNTNRHVRAWKAWEPFKDRHGRYVNGVLVDRARLRDAEDSAIISGGMNFYGDGSVALAREANFFHWGPPASPRQMTEEARRVFVNTIVYMKQFDGAKQTVWRNKKTRSRLPNWFDILRSDSKVPQLINILNLQLNSLFPPELVKRFGSDVARYYALYEPNIGYVYVPHGKIWYTIDEEARSVGVPNNDVRFLEKCIGLLSQPGEAAKAQRLLERYTGLSFPDAKAWYEWFESNRDKLYFSDYYGYRFYAGPAALGPAPTAVQQATGEIRMGEPNEVTPVSVGVVVVGDEPSAPGGSGGHELAYEQGGYVTNKGALVTLVVRLKIADGWHIYVRAHEAVRESGGRVEPTKIDVELPVGANWHGDWQTPTVYEAAQAGVFEYRGDAVFTRQLYFTSVPAEGRDVQERARMTLSGTVRFQSCAKGRCMFPYTTVPFEGRVIVDR